MKSMCMGEIECRLPRGPSFDCEARNFPSHKRRSISEPMANMQLWNFDLDVAPERMPLCSYSLETETSG